MFKADLKCAKCGREIHLSLPYSHDYIRYNNKWLCSECFTAISKGIPRVNWFERTEDYVTQAISKDKIDQLFLNHYDVSSIPNLIYMKLASIYNGTYKGIAQPIPPNELLDILERKMPYLDSNATKKNLEGIGRIHYDLAVAVGSYKSYKAMIESLKAEQELAKQNAEDKKPKPPRYVPPVQPSPPNYFIDLEDDGVM